MTRILVVTIISVFVAACGSGGGGSSSMVDVDLAPVAAEAEVTGKVIDGYIQGATVCLDLNNNFNCDSDEPSGVSGEGGIYSFTYDGSIPEGTQILADIPIGAVDEDLGTVDKPYSMLAPATNPEAVTPLSTLVSQEIISSGGQSTPEEAEKAVKLLLDIDESESLLSNDFVADENADIQEKATFVAEVLAVAKLAITDNPATADLTPAEISKASVQTAKSITADLVAAGSSNNLAAEDVDSVVTTIVTGEINNIVAASKAGDGEAVSLIEEIKEGNLIILSEGDNEITEDGEIVFREGLEMEFVYFPDAVEGELVDITSASEDKVAMLVYYGPLADTWVPIEWYDDDYRIADNGKWTLPTDLQGSGTKVTENCATFYDTGILEPSREICFIRKDVSGKQVRDIVPDFCSDGEGGVVEGCDEFADLPSGSFVYDATLTIAENDYGGDYQLWGSNGWRGYLDGAPSDEQTIQDFIGQFLADPNRYAFRGDNCNTAFRITSYATEERSGLIEWADASDGNCGSGGFSWAEGDTTETLPFTVEEVGNETILMTKSPVVLRSNNPDERDPYLIFGQAPNGLGQDENGIYGGVFTPSGTKFSYAFTGNLDYAIFASRVFVDFMLQQSGAPEFPYEDFLVD
jgi:hypothetical protein